MWVTGSAAPRVGRVIADHFTALGCESVLHAHQPNQTKSNDPRLVVTGPVEEEAAVEHMLQSILDRYGRIDIVVNSAAIWKPNSLESVTAEELRRYFDVNTLGSFLIARAAGLVMTQQKHGGAIINIGDWAEVRPYCDYAAYFPSKGAIPTMTRSLAVELGSRNPRVRVNAILPGPVLFGDDVSAEDRQAVIDSTLVKRSGTPEHIAYAAEFLAANDFITGIALPVDGGRQIYASEKVVG